MLGSKDLYGLLSLYGVIDYIQIHIQKPKGACVIDFFPISWKVTICKCKLLSTMENTFAMSLSECQNPWMIQMFMKAIDESFFNLEHGSQDNIRPYILGDKGYPLLPWLMICYHKLIISWNFNKILAKIIKQYVHATSVGFNV